VELVVFYNYVRLNGGLAEFVRKGGTVLRYLATLGLIF
jgi:hypothetical protein